MNNPFLSHNSTRRNPRFLLGIGGFLLMAILLAGCSGMERHQYVFWGDIVPEHPAELQDHWSDSGPFLPDDRTKKMRRGKAGVLRFYKEGNLNRSIPVDGELVVYVFEGVDGGIELTEPAGKLVISSEQLNKQRKFDKKNGYSYHIWLDLGEVDLPAESISILSVFTETKTREQVASGITYTRIGDDPSQEKAKTKMTASKKPLHEGISENQGEDLNSAPSNQEGENAPAFADFPEWYRQHQAAENAAQTEKTSTSAPNPNSDLSLTLDLSPSMIRQMNAPEAQYAAQNDNQSRSIYASPTTDDTRRETSLKIAMNQDAVNQLNQNQLNQNAASEAYPLPNNTQKLSFEDLRSIGGPSFGQQGYATQGVVTPNGIQTQSAASDSLMGPVKTNSPAITPPQGAAKVTYY